MQFIAVLLVSVAMVLLMIAPFRPAVGYCCSVNILGLAGGGLMAAFALFQMLAFALVIAIEKDLGGWTVYIFGPGANSVSTFG